MTNAVNSKVVALRKQIVANIINGLRWSRDGRNCFYCLTALQSTLGSEDMPSYSATPSTIA